ncbi:hypothetical protein [Paraliobacillus ryukyuensis]|uniref:hypothetical protein n=1 Tax=Paraliobacillus ryukyuensis TaxID=200904 RepID=UPI00117E08F6|nr:hypothetical protein [Paraliobacillus ryukyuensis]
MRGENANNYKGGNRIKTCAYCGDNYNSGTPYEYKTRKFCSKFCKNEYWKKYTLHNESFKKSWYEGNRRFRQELLEGRETKPERMVRKWLEHNKVFFIQEKGFFGKYFADFLSPKQKQWLK